MKGFVLAWAREGRRLWHRLSVPQRISVAGISVAAALGLTWMALQARAPTARHLVSARAVGGETRLRELRQSLESEGIPCQEFVSADGGLSLQVSSQDIELARGVLKTWDPAAESNGDDWLFNGGWFLPGQIVPQRLAESKRRRVQERICWADSIDRAGLEIDVPSRSPLRTYRTDGSATVTLYLASGVERLTTREVVRVRRIVCGAYDLAREVVTVTDNMGNPYGVEQVDAWADDDRFRADLEKDVHELLSGLFAEEEFTLVVRPFQAALPQAFGGASGGLLADGLGRIELASFSAASTALDDARPESIDDRDERGAAVVATFDSAAVKCLLDRSGGVFSSVEDFKADQRRAIECLLYPQHSRVSVLVRPFAKAGDEAGPQGRESRPAHAGRGDPAWNSAETWQAWLAAHWPLVVTAAAVSIAFAAIVVAVSKGCFSPRSPSSSTRRFTRPGHQAATESNRAERWTARAVESRPSSWRVFSGRSDPASGVNGQDSLLSATDRMSEWVRERPQTAASVLRVWLAEASTVGEADHVSSGGTP